MTSQAQNTLTEQDLEAINAFCDELETFLATGIMPWKFDTYAGVQTYTVRNPVVYVHPCGERKVACEIVAAPPEFAHLVGQHHSFSLLLL